MISLKSTFILTVSLLSLNVLTGCSNEEVGSESLLTVGVAPSDPIGGGDIKFLPDEPEDDVIEVVEEENKDHHKECHNKKHKKEEDHDTVERTCQLHDSKNVVPSNLEMESLGSRDETPGNQVGMSEIKSLRLLIGKIQFHKSGSSEASSSWLDYDVNESVDLIQLEAEFLAKILSEIKIPKGEYDQVRLVILCSEIELVDGSVYPLRIASSNTSGLKIQLKPALTVGGSESLSLKISYDLNGAIKMNANFVYMDPVLKIELI